MKTIDFKKDPIYVASSSPQIIGVPTMLFVMLDGEGAPESLGKGETEFQQAMQVLFGIVYAIKFWDKKFPTPPGYTKFTMAPIEALWWMTNGQSFDTSKPDDLRWTVMLRLPEFMTLNFFDNVVAACVANKKTDVYKKARLENFHEGASVQIMHIGPYSEEQPNIELMHAYAKEQGCQLMGKYHELYFGDPSRAAPDKLRTILRQAVEKV